MSPRKASVAPTQARRAPSAAAAPSSVPATLRTARLLLRPFQPDDAAAVERGLAAREVAEQTLTIPHPYPPGSAATWIGRHAEWYAAGKQAIWAIVHADMLVGAIGLNIVAAHRRAEAGYWIAKDAWGQGIATEALQAVLAHGFDGLGLHRIEAMHYVENPASGRVMQKAGMQREGRLRDVVHRDGVPRTNDLYAMLASDPRP